MNKHLESFIEIFTRYFILLLAGLGNLYIVYKLLIPLTTHVTNAILSIFTDTMVIGNIIYLPWMGAEIAPACVAGSAFYLLLLLILSTADIKPETRIKAIFTSFAMLFFLNIIRILVLIPVTNTSYFDLIHWICWHLISILFVVFIWFYIVKIYKIKSIPIYSDLKYLWGLINPVKKSKRKKKHN